MVSDPLALIHDLISLPGPSGAESAVTQWLAQRVRQIGWEPEIDAKGNLIVRVVGGSDRPHVLVTAHLDEIGLIITKVEPDGKIRVAAVGGTYPYKWGELPVEILTRTGSVNAVLSFGGIHSNTKGSIVDQARKEPFPWENAYLFTGLTPEELAAAGVRPGLRVALARSMRAVTTLGSCIASYFLDDRAPIAVWLMALEAIHASGDEPFGAITFAATSSEEVGGEGAQYLLRTHPADICVALEIGPKTIDADFPIDASPTIWVRDGYAAMESVDGFLLEERCKELGIQPHWQYLSRGGSDASCAAAIGLTARPVTFGIPVENSHGYEIMHKDAPTQMLRLLLDYLANVR